MIHNRSLEQYGMSFCNGTHTPMDQDADLRPTLDGEKVLSKQEHTNYRRLIGELPYLEICTRPEIAFAVSVPARSLYVPTICHQIMIRRVLRHLSGHRAFGLTNWNSKNRSLIKLEVCSVSDWSDCLEARCLTTGSCIMFNDAPVSLKVTRQSIVALSSAKAECIALSLTATDVL